MKRTVSSTYTIVLTLVPTLPGVQILVNLFVKYTKFYIGHGTIGLNTIALTFYYKQYDIKNLLSVGTVAVFSALLLAQNANAVPTGGGSSRGAALTVAVGGPAEVAVREVLAEKACQEVPKALAEAAPQEIWDPVEEVCLGFQDLEAAPVALLVQVEGFLVWGKFWRNEEWCYDFGRVGARVAGRTCACVGWDEDANGELRTTDWAGL